MATNWELTEYEGSKSEETIHFIGDAVRQQAVLQHPQRGKLILIAHTVTWRSCGRVDQFDVLCGESLVVTGRAAIQFADDNVIVVNLRFKRLDGQFAYERHAFRKRRVSVSVEFLTRFSHKFLDFVASDIGAALVATLILAIVLRRSKKPE